MKNLQLKIQTIPRACCITRSFSSWLSFNMVVRTGTKCSRSLGRHFKNCNMTFFRYSRFADSFSRSWFLSSLWKRKQINIWINSAMMGYWETLKESTKFWNPRFWSCKTNSLKYENVQNTFLNHVAMVAYLLISSFNTFACSVSLIEVASLSRNNWRSKWKNIYAMLKWFQFPASRFFTLFSG